MSEWQDIATAPKDGSRILGWSPTEGIAIVDWDGDFGGGWSVSHDAEQYRWQGYAPTMWQQLPTPPQEKTNG